MSDAGNLKCSACGGTEHLRPYSPWHSTPICKPCFMVWYDVPADPDDPAAQQFDPTDPAQIGALSLKLKARGLWPWTGNYAAKPVTP